MHRTAALAKTPLFQLPCEGLSIDERCRISHERVKAIVDFYREYPHTFLYYSPPLTSSIFRTDC